MGSTRSRVRSRRSGLSVAVTQAASPVGVAITRALVAASHEPTPKVSRVLALDDRRGDVDGALWRLTDVTDPELVQRLAGVDVVVHTAAQTDLAADLACDEAQRRTHAVRGVQTVVTAAAAAGVRRVVAVTSAMVYGAAPGAPVPLSEDTPLAAPYDSGLVGDLLEVEHVLARTPRVHPGVSVTVLRPAPLVGPGVDSVVTRHFEAPRLLAVRDSEMRWQFCHVDDLARAVARIVTDEDSTGWDGAFTVACEGSMPTEQVEQLSGLRRVVLPGSLAFGTAERLHRVGVLPMPAGDLAYVVYPWVVPSTRLLAAGWRPAYDNETCLQLLLEQVQGRHAVAARRVDRKDAALGAAGAAVALVGTAALVRQARRRRGG